ncbi:MAG: hypothetical protein AAFQ15_14110 [Pseudomonadota bacterium]
MIGKSNDDAKTFKLQLMISPAELDAIDVWRYTNRMPTRAAAIRELIRLGMSDAKQNSPALGGTEDVL